MKIVKASKIVILNNKNKWNDMGRYNKMNDSTSGEKASNERKINKWSPAKNSITNPEEFFNEEAQQRRKTEE